MIKKTIATLVFGLLLHTGFAQTFDKAKLDNYFQELEKSNRFMGSVALSENGKVVYTKSIGFADIETNTKSNENTKYRIGSISKSFTSTLVLKAIEEKKLKLDTKLNSYFPGITNADKITISNLLDHRSGIHNFTNDSTYLDWNNQAKSEAEMVKIIEIGGSDFEPDSKAEYSNSNYVLLSYILQKVYKKPYSEILTEKIIKPVGLKNTYVGGKINLKDNECSSYKFGTTWIKEKETDMIIPMGAGDIVSTPSDLTKFAYALFNGKIISAKSLELMKTMKDHYGYGLFQMPFGDKISYGHTGGIDGFSAVYGYFSTEKVGFALTSNGSNYNNNDISIVLLSAIFNKTYEIPSFKSYDVTTAELDKYLGLYSSKDIFLKITVTKEGKTLMAQATSQSAFGLEATEKDKFKFEAAGIKMEFNPAEKTMILRQGGSSFTFTKE
ncbi:MAG: serine hydrolase domain-containing protein [Chitinophagaceae bacterium]